MQKCSGRTERRKHQKTASVNTEFSLLAPVNSSSENQANCALIKHGWWQNITHTESFGEHRLREEIWQHSEHRCSLKSSRKYLLDFFRTETFSCWSGWGPRKKKSDQTGQVWAKTWTSHSNLILIPADRLEETTFWYEMVLNISLIWAGSLTSSSWRDSGCEEARASTANTLWMSYRTTRSFCRWKEQTHFRVRVSKPGSVHWELAHVHSSLN